MTNGETAEEGVAGFENGYGETALVVDNKPTVRLEFVDVLEDTGYRVYEAADGPGGLKIQLSDNRTMCYSPMSAFPAE